MADPYPQSRLRTQDISPEMTQDLYLQLTRKFFPELDPQPTLLRFGGSPWPSVLFLGETVVCVFRPSGNGAYNGMGPIVTRIEPACRNASAPVYRTFLVDPATEEVQFNPMAWWGLASALEDDLRRLRELDELRRSLDNFGLDMAPVLHGGT